MAKKYPLYFQKSKASKQLEYDYDLYSESGSFLGQSETSLDRYQVRPYKTKEKYKKTDEYPYYDDEYEERRRHSYDEDPYIYDSDYRHGAEYVPMNSESSGAESILDRQYNKHKKERKKRLYENPSYNYKVKQEESLDSYRKQRKPPRNSSNNEFTSNENDFSVYVSQQPIAFRLKSDGDYAAPLESSSQKYPKPSLELKRQRDYQEYMTEQGQTPHTREQGDAPQINPSPTDLPNLSSQLVFKEQISSFFQNNAQSLMGLVYLPVVVMNHSKTSLTTGSILPGLFLNNTNETKDETSKTPVPVFTAISTGHSVFQQENKSTNFKVSKSEPTEKMVNPKEQVSNSFVDMLQTTEGSAMTPSSYAELLTSHPVQSSTSGKNLLSLIKVSKIFKNKKKSSQVQSTSQIALSGNKKQDKMSGIKVIENLERDENNTNKMPTNKEQNAQERRMSALKNMDDSGNIVININKKSFTSSALPTASQTRDRKISKKSQIIQGKSLVHTNFDLADINEEQTQNAIKNQQIKGVIPSNRYSSYNPNNVDRRSRLAQKGDNGFSQGTGIEGKYKTVGPNQKINLGQNWEFDQEFGTTFNSQTTNDIYGQNYEGKAISVNNYNPRMSHAAERREQSLAELVEEGKKSGIYDKVFVARENGTNAQSREAKGTLKTKSILKKETINELNENNVQGVGDFIGYNQTNLDENIKKNQQENKKDSKLVVSSTRPSKSQPIRTKSVKSNKGNEMGAHELVSSSVEHSVFDEINSTQQVQPGDLCYELLHGKVSTTSIQSYKKNPPVNIIYPQEKKISTIHRSKENLLLQGKNTEELIHSKICQYSEFIIIPFNAAQYILGVSCYDKLIDVIDFFCNDDK